MHVLGHGFSQRRKSSNTKRPRDLDIRKVSFSGSTLSGCSLSSASSFSSSSSSSTTSSAARPNTSDRPAGFDPLAQHPTFTASSPKRPTVQAPRRLSERAYIHTEQLPMPRFDEHAFEPEPALTFFEDDEDDVSEVFTEQDDATPEIAPTVMPQQDEVVPVEPRDYFFTTVGKRPPMPRSHWSESTIQTLTPALDEDDGEDEEEDEEEREDDDVTPSLETFAAQAGLVDLADVSPRSSLARQTFNFHPTRRSATTTPKRPQMKTMDTVENLMKRGGWKRRGIVFHSEDMGTSARWDEFKGELVM